MESVKMTGWWWWFAAEAKLIFDIRVGRALHINIDSQHASCLAICFALLYIVNVSSCPYTESVRWHAIKTCGNNYWLKKFDHFLLCWYIRMYCSTRSSNEMLLLTTSSLTIFCSSFPIVLNLWLHNVQRWDTEGKILHLPSPQIVKVILLCVYTSYTTFFYF